MLVKREGEGAGVLVGGEGAGVLVKREGEGAGVLVGG